MPNLLQGLTSGAVASTVGKLVAPGNPLLGAGAGAIAARWAMRSTPAALALLAAGAGLRYYLSHRDGPKTVKPAATPRSRKPAAKRPTRKSAAKTAAAAA